MKKIYLLILCLVVLGVGCTNNKDETINLQQQQINSLLNTVKEQAISTSFLQKQIDVSKEKPTNSSIKMTSSPVKLPSADKPENIERTIEKVVERPIIQEVSSTPVQPIKQNFFSFQNAYQDYILSYNSGVSFLNEAMKQAGNNSDYIGANKTLNIALTDFQNAQIKIDKLSNTIQHDQLFNLKSALFDACNKRVLEVQKMQNSNMDFLNGYPMPGDGLNALQLKQTINDTALQEAKDSINFGNQAIASAKQGDVIYNQIINELK